MCGRLKLSASSDAVAEAFALEGAVAVVPRYNIAPSQDLPTVRALRQGGRGRVLEAMRFGFAEGGGKPHLNARAETLLSRPAFREAARTRRCLVVADGFYEWQADGRARRPWLIARRDGRPFGLAGVFDAAARPSCAIVTTSANAVVAPIHDRMPVIIRPDDYAAWLDPALQDPAILARLLAPSPPDELRAVRVGPRVNRPGEDDPGLCEPYDERADLGPLFAGLTGTRTPGS